MIPALLTILAMSPAGDPVARETMFLSSWSVVAERGHNTRSASGRLRPADERLSYLSAAQHSQVAEPPRKRGDDGSKGAIFTGPDPRQNPAGGQDRETRPGQGGNTWAMAFLAIRGSFARTGTVAGNVEISGPI